MGEIVTKCCIALLRLLVILMVLVLIFPLFFWYLKRNPGVFRKRNK